MGKKLKTGDNVKVVKDGTGEFLGEGYCEDNETLFSFAVDIVHRRAIHITHCCLSSLSNSA